MLSTYSFCTFRAIAEQGADLDRLMAELIRQLGTQFPTMKCEWAASERHVIFTTSVGTDQEQRLFWRDANKAIVAMARAIGVTLQFQASRSEIPLDADQAARMRKKAGGIGYMQYA